MLLLLMVDMEMYMLKSSKPYLRYNCGCNHMWGLFHHLGSQLFDGTRECPSTYIGRATIFLWWFYVQSIVTILFIGANQISFLHEVIISPNGNSTCPTTCVTVIPLSYGTNIVVYYCSCGTTQTLEVIKGKMCMLN